jgi:predicted O-methyltransferase YrrM
MSTPWLAQRCGVLYSIEDNETWYNIVQAQSSPRRLLHVHYFLCDHANYPDLSAYSDHSFDFVLIAGSERSACVRNVVPKLKPGGWIYLDNTDRLTQTKPESDFQKAERILLDVVHLHNGSVQYFTDFVPTNFVAKQGMLVQLF